MPRANNPSEVFARLDEAGYIRDVDAGASTTLSNDVTGDSSTKTLEVGDASGFEVDDLVRIETGTRMEVQKVNAIDTAASPQTITLDSQVAYDHASGDAVVEQEKVVLGDVTDDGVTEDVTADRNEITVATRSSVYTRLINQVDARIEFSVQNLNVENYLISVGITDANVTGTGGVDDKNQAVRDGAEVISGLSDISIYFMGTMDDGDTVEVQGWNALIDPNVTSTYDTGSGAPVPIAADVSTLVTKIWS